jgi:hypothetical protein
MATLYLITYDLDSPGQNYQPLWDALKRFGAKRALESVWVMRSAYSATQLRDALKSYIDDNDRLLVSSMNDWAAWRAMVKINDIQ